MAEYTSRPQPERYRPARRIPPASLQWSIWPARTNLLARDFLHGRAVAGLVGDMVRVLADDLPDAKATNPLPTGTSNRPASASRSLLTSFRRRAMACEFEVQLPTADAADRRSELSRPSTCSKSWRASSRSTATTAKSSASIARRPVARSKSSRDSSTCSNWPRACTTKPTVRSTSRAALSPTPGAFRAARAACRPTKKSPPPSPASA